ncbi:MAG: DUF4926 domain-containing protein [Terrimicrobiaceae bacterium]
MKFELYSRVALAEDLAVENLRRGDIATIIECYEGLSNQQPGYEIEVFNAVGETISFVTVRESQIEPLRRDEVLTVRPRLATAA